MQHKKAYLATRFNLSQRGSVLSMASLILVLGGFFYVQNATAETNAEGVEIEVIENDASNNAAGDPVKTFLNDIETDEVSQSDLWSRIKDRYAMPNINSEYTAKHEAWYASRPEYVSRMIERSQKYLFHIVEEVEKRGMPSEIALLPMIESAYNPQAYSRSRASGIWQFVPATGKDFGLKQNWWVDNRRDVTAATDAALTYLQKLHSMFGAWDLALAAYNAGEGTVQRAIERNRKAGLPTDYQNLNLPPETRNYVPKLQAIKNIITDPERYGLSIDSVPNRAYFAEVTAPKQIDAKLAAQLAEVSFEEFSALNPGYNRPVITSSGEVHQLLLPVWAAERFKTNLANYDKPLTSWKTYQAKRGEHMGSIAKKFGMNVSQLRYVNDLPNTKKLRASQPVLVAANYSAQNLNDVADIEVNETPDDVAEIEPTPRTPVIHKVKRGETLQGLAEKYDLQASEIIKINRLKSDKLKAGQVIRLNKAGIKTKNRKILASYKSKKYKASSKSRSKIKSRKSSSRHINTHTNIRLR